jgi:hypothetical protein
VDAWVAAVFKVGIIDDPKNLLLVHSRMKTLLKHNAGEVGQESAAPEVDSFLLATDSPDSIKRGTELYEICFEKETLEFVTSL